MKLEESTKSMNIEYNKIYTYSDNILYFRSCELNDFLTLIPTYFTTVLTTLFLRYDGVKLFVIFMCAVLEI